MQRGSKIEKKKLETEIYQDEQLKHPCQLQPRRIAK